MARHSSAVFIAAFLATQGVASAQVVMGRAHVPGVQFHPPVLTSPSPPARPDPAPPAHPHQPGHHVHGFAPLPGEDLFRARPDTYRPRKDASLFFRRADFYPAYVAPEVIVQPAVVERTKVVVVGREEPAAAKRGNAEAGVEARVAPVAPAIVGVRKTVYVIPRCYAGDKPPDVSRLPEGCDIRDMRVIDAR